MIINPSAHALRNAARSLAQRSLWILNRRTKELARKARAQAETSPLPLAAVDALYPLVWIVFSLLKGRLVTCSLFVLDCKNSIIGLVVGRVLIGRDLCNDPTLGQEFGFVLIEFAFCDAADNPTGAYSLLHRGVSPLRFCSRSFLSRLRARCKLACELKRRSKGSAKPTASGTEKAKRELHQR